MKWCFLLNSAPYVMEFLGKISYQVVADGNECLIVANSKISEFDYKKYFSKDAIFISKADWCADNYKKNRDEFKDLSWKELFPTFERKTKLKIFEFNYENSVEIVSQLYCFFDLILEREKPDVVINEAPSNVFTEVAYNLCKKKGIAYLGLTGSRFDGRIDVYDTQTTCSGYEQTFNKLSAGDISQFEIEFAKNFTKGFISHENLPSGTNPSESFQAESLIYFQRVNILRYYIKRLRQIFKARLKYFFNKKRFQSYDYESEAAMNSVFMSPYRAFLRKIRIFRQKNIYKYSTDNDKFFLFPLHFQPESSTSALSTYFCDQLNTVRNIAFSLPFPYKLYVKEHPQAVGTREDGFYKELLRAPNVVLISPYEKTESLIRNSRGIITLTSTIGMEAALAGKPVYVLGNVFYVYHPACVKIDSFEQLRQKLRIDMTSKPIISDLDGVNARFIISYFRNTIKGDIFFAAGSNDSNNYKGIYNSIKNFFANGTNGG